MGNVKNKREVYKGEQFMRIEDEDFIFIPVEMEEKDGGTKKKYKAIQKDKNIEGLQFKSKEELIQITKKILKELEDEKEERDS